MKYNVQIDEFCKTYGLGDVTASHLFPKGILNRTYFIDSTTGKYVIKALNPSRIDTADEINRLETAEHIAELAKESGIPSISAKRINGKVVNTLHDQHYIVFDFLKGSVKPLRKITPENCFEIGQLLANMHQIDFQKLSHSNFNEHLKTYDYGGQIRVKINWNYYFKAVSQSTPSWLSLFEENLNDLCEMIDISFPAYLSFIPQDIIIAHADLSDQNVLWKSKKPSIIDWEQSCFIDPTYDCVQTAIKWATKRPTEDDNEAIDKERLYAFLKGYTEIRNLNVENIEISFYMVLYKRLTYLRRVLMEYLEPEDEISKERAERRIKHTLMILGGYKKLIDQLETLKQDITDLQPEQTYQKSPSYDIIPKMEKLIKNYDAQTRELNYVKKWAIGLRIFRKIKSIFTKD